MSDDIKMLRNFIEATHPFFTEKCRDYALVALDRLEAGQAIEGYRQFCAMRRRAEKAESERDALHAKLEKAREALSVPQVWSEAERNGMAKAFADADGKHGHYETLFAVAAWLLRHRAIRAEIEARNKDGEENEYALRSEIDERNGWLEDAERENASLRAKLEKAREVLKPFAREADRQDTFRSDDTFGTMMSVGSLRRARTVLAELFADDAPAQPSSFQDRVQSWMMTCFGPEISSDQAERNHRFLEEALELMQACNCSREDAHQLVDYVYDRPVGEPHQEVGGVQVTLAALCLANNLDMHKAGEDELACIWSKVDKIRAKQAAKPKGSPLPQHVAPAQPPQISDEMVEAAIKASEGEDDYASAVRKIIAAALEVMGCK